MPQSIPPLDHGKDDQDDLVFLEEQTAQPATSAQRKVWRVMIIDDDEDVHSTTTFALGNLDMQHRPLEFVHAYSAAQARELLKHEQEIAVILLDVVMEQDDAGLHLVRYIRETLKLADVRIILRTGQPGYAPDRCDSRFRHQRLQDQVRADPHQTVHHRDGRDPLLRTKDRKSVV